VSWIQREFVSLEKSVQSWHHVLLLFRSLDHPVRSRQYVRRDRENDLLRRLQIDDEFELRRLLDGKLGRVDSLQDSVHGNMRRAGSCPRTSNRGQATFLLGPRPPART
jgi:hypothetical protein